MLPHPLGSGAVKHGGEAAQGLVLIGSRLLGPIDQEQVRFLLLQLNLAVLKNHLGYDVFLGLCSLTRIGRVTPLAGTESLRGGKSSGHVEASPRFL